MNSNHKPQKVTQKNKQSKLFLTLPDCLNTHVLISVAKMENSKSTKIRKHMVKTKGGENREKRERETIFI